MKFDDKTYKQLFYQLYEDTAQKYNLNIENVDETTMNLKNNIFTLTIGCDLDTVWIYYTLNKEKKTYLISNYININAEKIDRENISKINTIPKIIERTLIIQSRVLIRKFSNLLEGKLEWFDDYKKSQYFHQIK